ncbi:MAG: cell division protein CrgA, partial [Demequina sp.]|nr:cell division protein CrgA [Demequina sp.]
MAVSKKRNKSNAVKVPRSATKPQSDNPKWLVPTFSTLLLVGLVWILVYYISRGTYPFAIGNVNIFIGFAMLL